MITSIALLVFAVIVLLATRRALAIKQEKREIARLAKMFRDYDFSARQYEQDSAWGGKYSR